MQYDKGKRCTFFHRYQLVWITKCRYKALTDDIRLRVREIIREVCAENRVEIIKGALVGDHAHMFVSIPSNLSVSDLMRKIKGRSSHKVQWQFLLLNKRYWGRHFWRRGYFLTTNVTIPDNTVLQYLEQHSDKSTDAIR